MLLHDNLPRDANGLTTAKERVRIGSVPDWVTPCALDVHFRPKYPAAITHLLVNRQIHAEHRGTYVHNAMRLETMDAVQQYSQWRLEFEPRTQSIALHWIR